MATNIDRTETDSRRALTLAILDMRTHMRRLEEAQARYYASFNACSPQQQAWALEDADDRWAAINERWIKS